jgi:nucleotide sugar dehydrogenase
MTVSLIGLGEIGFEILKELSKKRKDVISVDVDDKKLAELGKKGYRVSKDIPKSEVYIISVYLTEQIFNVLDKIDCSANPLVVIESTLMPGTCEKIAQFKKKKNIDFDVVIFPHRYNPNDLAHHVFNLHRVMGGDAKSLERAKQFYKSFIDLELIHFTTPEIAELCKPLENAYRFIEIAFAEELKMLCMKQNINFSQLREACNTKWNINIKEAREGVGGKCLPKDLSLIDSFFKDNVFFSTARKIDEIYKGFSKNGN